MVQFWNVGHSNSYSYGPNHSKTEPLEIRTKPLEIRTKPLEIKTKWLPFCSKQETIGKLNAIGKPNRGLPLEFGTHSVLQPSVYWSGFQMVGLVHRT